MPGTAAPYRVPFQQSRAHDQWPAGQRNGLRGVYRFRTRCRVSELQFGSADGVRQDRGPFGCDSPPDLTGIHAAGCIGARCG